MARCPRNRFSVLTIAALQAVFVFTVLRLVLLGTYWKEIPHGVSDLVWALWTGFRMDVAVVSILSAPFVLYCALLPDRAFGNRIHLRFLRVLYFAAMFWFVFLNISDFYFFDEFNSRFNYVAIEYLFVSPTEVVGNIWQSYPVPAVVTGVGIVIWLFWKWLRACAGGAMNAAVSIRARLIAVVVAATVGAASFATVSISALNKGSSRILAEIGADGFYTLGYALLTNKLNYEDFYSMMDKTAAYDHVRALVTRPGQTPVAGGNPLERIVSAKPGLGKLNVVIILEESLGSKFIGRQNKSANSLTPNVDALSAQGIFFNRFYSTGTRTIRGLEAVLASFPPIPGASIVKRSGSDNVETLARVMKRLGYKTLFIYGGRGVFDNMRRFTMANGFERFIEQKDFPKGCFTTAWGVADENLFTKVIETFDALDKDGGPFFATVLTVSNHKPYLYPEGRIDLDPKKRSRDHAVKYADWALGEFFKQAASHPFFDKTVFVVLGDHGARVYGADFIPIESYEIPLMIYSPKNIKPQQVETAGCSMDVAPTIMGLLGIEYQTTFYGRDVLSLAPADGYALLQHDRDVAILRGDRMAILSTGRREAAYSYQSETRRFTEIPKEQASDLLSDAISYYETGYDLFSTGRFRVTAPDTAR